MIVLVGDRENTTKNIVLHFMILVIAVGRVYGVEEERSWDGWMEKGKEMMLRPCGILG